MMKWLTSFSGGVGGNLIGAALSQPYALVEASKHRQIGREQATCSFPSRFGVLVAMRRQQDVYVGAPLHQQFSMEDRPRRRRPPLTDK
jgi:hypothetical protein